MTASRLHTFGTEERGEHGERTEELTLRWRLARRLVRCVVAAGVFTASALALSSIGAPAAYAATTSCQQSLSSNSAWSHTGSWKSSDSGGTWIDNGDGSPNDNLSRSVSNLPTSGAQITFDWSWNWADTGGNSAAANVTVSYDGKVYATLASPGPNVHPRTASVSASNGASISPGNGQAQATWTTYTITLPNNVASSGNLLFNMTGSVAEGWAPSINNIAVRNIKASSTNCADLAIAKTGPTAAQPNGQVAWNISVTNNGLATSDYTVTDHLPAGVTGTTTATPGCSLSSNVLTCQGTGLAVGSTRTIQVRAIAPNTGATTMTNTASVSGPLPDPDTSNNQSSVTTSIAPVLNVPAVDLRVAGVAVGATGLAFVVWAQWRRGSRGRAGKA